MFNFIRSVLILIIVVGLSSCSSRKKKSTPAIQVEQKPLNVVSVLDFGAIPNDGKDDSQAIQNAINEAIISDKSSMVYCPPGTYDLYKGVVVAHQIKSGDFTFVTMVLSGHIPAYSSNPKIGSTTTFKLHNPEFGVAFQLARNCVVRNIVFEGCARFSGKPEDIIDRKLNESSQHIKTNRFSPSCAVVIDPFHTTVPEKDRYANHTALYKNKARGGSSMLLIQGCSFFNHYIAIANNTSAAVANGDNIRAEQCHANNVHTFWSTGQTQCRANSIDNVYAIGIHTFVSGSQIGSQGGTPPSLRNINIAGFCRSLVDLNTGFSGFSAYQSYFESIWSLGVANVNFVSFNQCHIKFYHPSDKVGTPPVHLKSNVNVSFNDCDIAYFSNCKERIPFIFDARHITLNGGQIEGGIVTTGGVSNAGGDQVHKVTYNDVLVKCKSTMISQHYSGRIRSSLYGQYYVGGATIDTYDGKSYKISGDTYLVEYTEKAKLKPINESEAYFISADSRSYKTQDNLFSSTPVKCALPNGQNLSVRPALGYISRINKDSVFVKGVNRNVVNIPLDIYLIDYHYLSPEIEGTATVGSTKIMSYSASGHIREGMRIKSPGLPKNCYITKITKDFIELNKPVSKTGKLTLPGKLVEITPRN